MKKSVLLFALPLVGMMITGCEKKNKHDTPSQVDASISLNKTSLVLKKSASETLTATVSNGSGDVTWTSSNTAVATVDSNGNVTAVEKGNATITATYSGKTATCQVTVKGILDSYALAAVQDNENIKDFKNNVANENHEFKGETDPILQVGDDNAVDVKPILKILDLDTMEAAPQDAWDFDYELKLQLFNGEAYADTTDDYGTFDAENCTFDFNEAAIGKQFKLSVMPGGLTDEQKADPTNSKEIELKVNNGWNVYSADELAYFNDINFLDSDRQTHHPAGVNESWVAFRQAKGLSTTYVAPAIYLQKSVQIKKDNLPSVFFYTEAEAGGHDGWPGHMKDASDIYCHYANGFSFNGNYFHIDTSEVPLGVEDEDMNYDDGVSHSTLFKVSYRTDVTPSERQVVEYVFKNASYFGNASRGNDDTRAYGLIFTKVNNTQYTNNTLLQATFDNFNLKSACIGFFAEEGETKMIIKDCIVKEGYSNCFYLYNNGIVDIQNSDFRNFGGPIFITDGDDEYTVNGFEITVDEATVLDNWITGSEPWFTSTKDGGPATAIPEIQKLDAAVTGLSQALSGGAYTKTFLRGTEKFMNLLIINYGEILDVTFKKGNGNRIGVDQSSTGAAPFNRDTALSTADGGHWLLTTDAGGIADVNPGTGDATPLAMNQFTGNYMDAIGKFPGFGYLSLFFEIIDQAA